VLLRWDRAGRVQPVALQRPEAAELLRGLTAAERMASWHLISPSGERRSGGDACSPLLLALPGGQLPGAVFARFPGLTARGYGWVAEHRSRLSGWLPPSAKQRAGQRVRARAQLSLRERREAIVREHMESENRHEFDVTLQTFDHPRYEIVPTGEVHDGAEEVAEYFRATRAAFPDQRNENAVIHHSDDAVIVEFDLLGTHRGELRGIKPTGRSFRCRMIALFLFAPGGDRITCERVYFDQATIAEQLLGAGT
jgi:steroid delta-isomerase-like uncharacterized protein